MKKILTFILVLITINTTAQNLSFLKRFEIENYYDNNILRLSDKTLKEYESGSNPDKFRLKSSDDLITAFRLDLGIKHNFPLGHTQINKIVLKFNKYWQNDFMNEAYIRFSLQQFLSRDLNFQLNYYYYPEIYSNSYRSVLDDDYHSYTYSKNVYNAVIRWDISKNLALNYKFEYGQYYYNKYFTEYDSENIKNQLDLQVKLLPNLHSTLSYAYRISHADAAEAYTELSHYQAKDASYKANISSLQLVVPQLISLNKSYVQLRIKLALEGYYYQSNLSGDSYHLNRDDNYVRLYTALNFPLKKNFTLITYLNSDERRTDSPYSSVEEDKNYSRMRSGFSLIYKF
jgi:hypothetical protein